MTLLKHSNKVHVSWQHQYILASAHSKVAILVFAPVQPRQIDVSYGTLRQFPHFLPTSLHLLTSESADTKQSH